MVTEKILKQKPFTDRTAKIGKDFQKVRAATRQLAEDSVDAVRQTANDFIGESQAKAREAAEIAQSKLQAKPVRSILIAAAIGFCCGYLVRRR